MAERVRVVVRARPPAKQNPALDLQTGGQVTLSLRKADAANAISTSSNLTDTYTFKFDRAFADASQEEVYDACAADIVTSVCDGFNGTVLAYGQTGAGKTYTMSGSGRSYRGRGLIPRAIKQVYEHAANRPDLAVSVRVSYIEVYNETLVDLLAPPPAADAPPPGAAFGAGATAKRRSTTAGLGTSRGEDPGDDGGITAAVPGEDLVITELPGGAVIVRGLACPVATSESAALALLFEGDANRAIGSHLLNRASSRSHAVFTLTLDSRPVVGPPTAAKLHLVDLAGSERLHKTGSAGGVAREAQHINKSLSFLEQVVVALGDKSRDHVPFRSSKLTHLLRDSLGGGCRTSLLAAVWAEPAHAAETLTTLQLATRMLRVTVAPVRATRPDALTALKAAEAEIRALRAAGDAMTGHVPPPDQLTAAVRSYLEAGTTVAEDVARAPLDRLCGAGCPPAWRAALAACRTAVGAGGGAAAAPRFPPSPQGTIVVTVDPPPSATGYAPDAHGFAPTDAVLAAARATAASAPLTSYVGDLEAGCESDAALWACAPPPPPPPQPPLPATPAAVLSPPPALPPLPPTLALGPLPDMAAAFDDYKRGAGAAAAALVAENKRVARERRAAARVLGLALNAAVTEMEALAAHGDAVATAAAGGGAPVGSSAATAGVEAAAVTARVRALKGEYRDAAAQLKQARSEGDYASRLVESCMSQLVTDFEAWYAGVHLTGVCINLPAPVGGGGGGDDDAPPLGRRLPPASAGDTVRMGHTGVVRGATTRTTDEDDEAEEEDLGPEASTYLAARQQVTRAQASRRGTAGLPRHGAP